jgi:predicted signal transduction protein with EAL and GGDEF domain
LTARHRIDDAEADRRLRQTTAITGLLSIAFVGWAMILDQYGTPR